MGSTIRVDRRLAHMAFSEEIHSLQAGERSRYLQGFTDLRIVREHGDFPSEYSRAIYMATRVRDGKTYGIQVEEWSEALYDQSPFSPSALDSSTKVELREIAEKTKTISYYEYV